MTPVLMRSTEDGKPADARRLRCCVVAVRRSTRTLSHTHHEEVNYGSHFSDYAQAARDTGFRWCRGTNAYGNRSVASPRVCALYGLGGSGNRTCLTDVLVELGTHCGAGCRVSGASVRPLIQLWSALPHGHRAVTQTRRSESLRLRGGRRVALSDGLGVSIRSDCHRVCPRGNAYVCGPARQHDRHLHPFAYLQNHVWLPTEIRERQGLTRRSRMQAQPQDRRSAHLGGFNIVELWRLAIGETS